MCGKPEEGWSRSWATVGRRSSADVCGRAEEKGGRDINVGKYAAALAMKAVARRRGAPRREIGKERANDGVGKQVWESVG